MFKSQRKIKDSTIVAILKEIKRGKTSKRINYSCFLFRKSASKERGTQCKNYQAVDGRSKKIGLLRDSHYQSIGNEQNLKYYSGTYIMHNRTRFRFASSSSCFVFFYGIKMDSQQSRFVLYVLFCSCMCQQSKIGPFTFRVTEV